MGRFSWFIVAFLLFASPSYAACNNSANGDLQAFDGNGNACVTTSTAGSNGGTLALTNASTLLSTLALIPNSAAWPTKPLALIVLNEAASAGNLYVCPLGGTCTIANGFELVPGRSWTFPNPSTNATAIAASTAKLQAQW